MWPLTRVIVTAMTAAAAGAAPAQESPVAPVDPDGPLSQVESQFPTEDDTPPSSMPIVVLNQERLLSQSRYGQRIQREVEDAGAALAAENRQIETQLTEEELRLTEQRGTMTIEEFRPLAEEFDARVEAIRAAQEAKSRALQTQAEAAQAEFFERTFPLLIEVLRAREATVLMDSRAVLLSVEGADITEAAIAVIDAEIGEGPEAPVIDLDGTGGQPRPRPNPEGTP